MDHFIQLGPPYMVMMKTIIVRNMWTIYLEREHLVYYLCPCIPHYSFILYDISIFDLFMFGNYARDYWVIGFHYTIII